MTRKTFIISLTLFIALGLVIGLIQGRPDGQLHLIFCDVGQGDAILVKTPSGHTMLIDGGPDRRVLDCLGRYLPFWQRSLSVAVMTHPQADHMAGFVDVFGSMDVDNFLTTGVENQTQIYKELISQISSKHIKTTQISTGDQIDFGDGARMLVVWPDKKLIENWKGPSQEDVNTSSVSVELSFGKFCAVLTGDLPALQEGILKVDNCPVLKAGHHGSKTSNSDEFLSKVSPKEFIISVGRNNRYGHPSPDVVERVKNKGIRIWRTDQEGNIDVVVSGDQYWVESSKGR